MFYALEDDFGFKMPVIFVHGINGSAREFAMLAAELIPIRCALPNGPKRPGPTASPPICAKIAAISRTPISTG